MKLAKRLSLILSLGIFYLLLIELMLRAFFWIHQDYDLEMWKYGRDLKQNVADNRAHIHLPSRSSHLMGVDVEINSDGLRNRELPPAKASGTYRIAVMGDSFTLGWGVPEEQTYARLIEQNLRKRCGPSVETLNFGIGNYNTQQVTAATRLQALPKQPDQILYGFYWNDAEPIQHEPEGFLKRHLYLYAFWRKVRVRVFGQSEESENFLARYGGMYDGASWEKYRPDLDELISLVRDHHVPLSVALLPELRGGTSAEAEKSYKKVETYLQQKGVQVINLEGRPEFQDWKNMWVSKDDPHPNALAQAAIARLVEPVFWRSCPK
ncbi:MAG: SGNH/GDSL hydrolase family protein [Bdellovibrionota bacterium]